MSHASRKVPLNTSQLTEFHSRGLLRVDGLIDRARVDSARDAVLGALSKKGVWKDGAWQLDHLSFTERPGRGSDLVRGARHAAPLKELVTPALEETILQIAGEHEVGPMTEQPQILFTLPNAETWIIPATIWHLDVPRLPEIELPGVQMFTFLNEVVPGGGGTLVVAGSHRLLNGKFIRSRDIKRRLRRWSFFSALMSKTDTDRHRFMEAGAEVDGVDVQVVELHGEPGDVYLMDMRLLHTLAPNAGEVPRIMATQRFLTDESWAELARLGMARDKA